MVHYTGYSFMVSGYNRLPIVTWLREQATEGLVHAQEAGEMITLVGGYPSLAIGELLDCRQHDTGRILRESLAAEGAALAPIGTFVVVRGAFAVAAGRHPGRAALERGLQPGDGHRRLPNCWLARRRATQPCRQPSPTAGSSTCALSMPRQRDLAKLAACLTAVERRLDALTTNDD